VNEVRATCICSPRKLTTQGAKQLGIQQLTVNKIPQIHCNLTIKDTTCCCILQPKPKKCVTYLQKTQRQPLSQPKFVDDSHFPSVRTC